MVALRGRVPHGRRVSMGAWVGLELGRVGALSAFADVENVRAAPTVGYDHEPTCPPRAPVRRVLLETADRPGRARAPVRAPRRPRRGGAPRVRRRSGRWPRSLCWSTRPPGWCCRSRRRSSSTSMGWLAATFRSCPPMRPVRCKRAYGIASTTNTSRTRCRRSSPTPCGPRVARTPRASPRPVCILDTAYPVLDAQLAREPWTAGAAVTMADCAAAPALFYARAVHRSG